MGGEENLGVCQELTITVEIQPLKIDLYFPVLLTSKKGLEAMTVMISPTLSQRSLEKGKTQGEAVMLLYSKKALQTDKMSKDSEGPPP